MAGDRDRANIRTSSVPTIQHGHSLAWTLGSVCKDLPQRTPRWYSTNFFNPPILYRRDLLFSLSEIFLLYCKLNAAPRLYCIVSWTNPFHIWVRQVWRLAMTHRATPIPE
jgi:hypothetical protein